MPCTAVTMRDDVGGSQRDVTLLSDSVTKEQLKFRGSKSRWFTWEKESNPNFTHSDEL